MDKTYYVYILASARNGTLYIGVTNGLVRRVYEHRTGAVDGFTKTHDVKRLVRHLKLNCRRLAFYLRLTQA